MNNQRVFLLGATGYVGQRIAAQLISSGFQADALIRNPDKASLLPSAVRVIVGDLSQPSEWIHHVDHASAVINAAFPSHGDGWAAAVVEEKKLIEQLANRLRGTQTKLILSNGTAFLGDSGSERLDETAPVAHCHPASVRGPLLQQAIEAADNRLIAMEIRLASFVYGYGGSVFIPILRKAAQKTHRSIYLGDGEVYTSTVHVDAAARAYVSALRRGEAGETYHIASDEEPSIKDIARAVAVSIGSECKAVSVSEQEAQQYVDPFTAMFLGQNNRLDSRKARQALKWSGHAPTSFLWDIAYGSYAS